YVGVGRRGNVRPGDLVGAIANETGLAGRDIGPIRISDHYSVVGVPESSVDEVVNAITRSTVKGKKAKARRYVD
ncbi:MAG: DbpA RNA binding domain-containing protein, partial [Acidimicrobiales bacterium]